MADGKIGISSKMVHIWEYFYEKSGDHTHDVVY